jgi:MYXO-CTERM domain-containing protein
MNVERQLGTPIAKGDRMRSINFFAFPLLALSSSLAIGCSTPADPGPSVAMQDSFEITLFGKAQDDLHTPYVAGAKFSITVATTDYPQTAAWVLESSDPTVIAVSSAAASTSFPVSAMGVGHATLTVKDSSGKIYDQKDVDVAQPDHAQLCAHGLLLAGLSDDQSQVTQARVVAGGTATFLVRYFQGAQELYGNGAVTPTATGAVTATSTTSSFADDRDWVEIDALEGMGTGSVTLVVGGSPVTVVPATVVAASGIASVGALPQLDSGATNGDTLYVFARAFDASGNDVYGGSFNWTVAGMPVTSSLPTGEPSDTLSYTFAEGKSETIDVGDQGLSAAVTVQATGGAAATSVGSTENVGCSVSGAPGSSNGALGFAALALAAAGALVSRRRRA